jgi:hypothetical protein
MGISLGFEFDKVHIKKAGYIPQAYADQENDQNFIRRSLVEVFRDERPIPLNIVSLPIDQESVNAQKNLQSVLTEHYKSGKPFPVKIVDGKN